MSRLHTLRILALVLAAAAGGCGKVADLEPVAGKALPVKPMMAKTTPSAEELLTPPAYARPDRVDELLKRSEPREPDPFDLPPPTGGMAPAMPAGAEPEGAVPDEATGNETGPVDPGN